MSADPITITPLDVHPRLTHELHRALSERAKCRERGDWVTKQGWDLVIDSLLRVMRGRDGAQ